METQLAQRIATDSWRLNRISAIEDNLFALGLHEHGGNLSDHEQIDAALTSARVFTLESKQLQLLTLYEQRLNRAVQKNLALLQSLQAARKAEREAKMKEAGNLLKLSEMKGVEYRSGARRVCFFERSDPRRHRPRTPPPTRLDHRFQQIQTPKLPHTSSLNELDSVLSVFIRFHLRPIGF